MRRRLLGEVDVEELADEVRGRAWVVWRATRFLLSSKAPARNASLKAQGRYG